MKYTYEELAEGFMIKRIDEDGGVAYVPINPDNADYQAYLKSLDETDSL